MSDEFDDGNDSKGIKSLREAYEKANAERAALEAELNSFRQEKRQASVAEVLKAKGVNPKAAQFYAGDDTSEDAVGKWIEANADVFGVPAAQQAPDPNVQSAARVAAASYGAPQTLGAPQGQPVMGNVSELQTNIEALPYEVLVTEYGFPPLPGKGR